MKQNPHSYDILLNATILLVRSMTRSQMDGMVSAYCKILVMKFLGNTYLLEIYKTMTLSVISQISSYTMELKCQLLDFAS